MADKLKMTCIGDSLTMGFQSLAIHAVRSEWSFPALIARSMGLNVPLDFRVPRIPGPGLPLDIEGMLRFLQERVGLQVSLAEWIVRFPLLAHEYMDHLEDYYERGAGALPRKYRGIFHNLAVWGMTVRESLSLTPELCVKAIHHDEGFIDDDFIGVPSGAMYRTAQRVLGSCTQIEALERLAQSEKPDVILLWLGANDCLPTVVYLDLRDMEEEGGPISDDPLKRRDWTLTSAEVFERDYAELAARVAAAAPAAKVFVGTIPEVTIPPITNGIGPRNGNYYDYYARFFVDDRNFSPRFDHLTGQQARHIDQRIARFNQTIQKAAERHGFHVVDVCEVMRQLAVKRNNYERSPDQALRRYYHQTPDHPLLQLHHIPSALNFDCDAQGKPIQGGLFSLDGVHPSTLGYGIIAEAFLTEMQRAGVPGANPARLSWQEILAHDALLNDCSPLWSQVAKAAGSHPGLWNLIFRTIG